jgi:hypothetical protein
VYETELARLTALVSPLTGALTAEAVTISDWASRERREGFNLYRQAIAGRVLISLGDSEASQRVKAKLGLGVVSQMKVHKRAIRPGLGVTPEKSRSIRAHRGSAAMRAVPVKTFGQELSPLLQFTPSPWSWTRRTLAGVNAVLDCPAGKQIGYLLLNGDARQVGYAILALRSGECRLIDFLMASNEVSDWANGIAAVLPQAHAQDAEFICAVSTCRLMASALKDNGVRAVYSVPVVSQIGMDLQRVHLTMTDGDLFLSQAIRTPAGLPSEIREEIRVAADQGRHWQRAC